MEAIRTVGRELAPGAPVVPFMSTGATDSRFYRARGKTCFGLLPLPATEEDEKGFHGHNERVRVESVRFGVEFVYKVILEVGK